MSPLSRSNEAQSFTWQPTKVLKFGLAAFALFIGFLIFSPFRTVPTGYRGVVTHFGKVQKEILDEGLHFVVPVMTSVHLVSVQIQKDEIKTTSSSRDLQEIDTHVVINWTINPAKVADIYQQIGPENVLLDTVISPAVSEVFKAASAKKTIEEIIGKRIELTTDVDAMLKERMARYDVIINDISLVNVSFTPEFNKAVEAKQVAEQEAKQAEYTAQRAIADAKAAVNKAKGEAESALTVARSRAEAQRLLQQTLTPYILQQQAIEKWNGEFPQYFGGGNLMFNIPTAAAKKVKVEAGE